MKLATVPTDGPVQLTLDLRSPTARVRREPRPYWQHLDRADLGGDLRGRADGMRVLLSTEACSDGLWIGYHDLLLSQSGSSGPTRPQPTRLDALTSAAYNLQRHCAAVLKANGKSPRTDHRAAKRVLEWLTELDLL